MKSLRILTIASFLLVGTAWASEIPFPENKKLDNKIVKKNNQPIALKNLGPRPGFAGYYLAGRHAQAEQDWHAANYYFDIVSRKDPVNDDLKRRTMVVSMGAGDLATASKYAQYILKDTPGDSLATLFLSAYNLKMGDPKVALIHLRDMEDGGMSGFATPILVSWFKAIMGQHDIEELQPQPLDAFHAALIGRLLDKEEKSLPLLEKTLQITKDNPSMKLGDAFLVLNKTEEAKKIYQKVDAIETSRSLRNRLHYIKTQKESDKPSFLQAVTSKEGTAIAFIDMAKILYAQESADSARIFAHIGLNIYPNIEDGHILLAKIYSETGQFDEAVNHYRKIPTNSRYATEIQLKISEIQESIGQETTAIEGLKKLHSKKPHVDLIIQVGDIKRRNEDYKSAIKYYNDSINLFEDNVSEEYWFLYYVRGMSYERIGKWENAEQDFKKALEFRPNEPSVLNYLAYGWAERGVNLAKSLEYLERAISRRPTDGHIHDSLGWAFYKLGQYKNAIEPLEKAITYLPYDPTVNEHLGDAYWQVGRKREALFQWERALNHIEDSYEQDEHMEDRLNDKIVNGLPINDNVMAAENNVAE